MISFIIPTLLKSDVIIELLTGLNEQECISEIILINNALSYLPFEKDLQKLKVVTPAQNLYVNSSWNIGVELAKEDKIAICNDDILFNFSKLVLIQDLIKPHVGIIGMADSNFSPNDREEIYLRKIKKRGYGFGTLMFLSKSNYITIPEDLKIWYGDDYLFNNQANPNYILEGMAIKTKMSSTSSLPIFNDTINQDTRNYNLYYKPKTKLSRIILNKIKQCLKLV